MIVDLINNAALLITLSAFMGIFTRFRKDYPLLFRILTGIWFGLIAIAGMLIPFEYKTGVIFDGRSIVISMAGLFGGGIPALIAASISGVYRIYLGGPGIWAGVTTIIFSAAIGYLFRRAFQGKPESINILLMFGIGIIVHIVMVLCQLLFPWPSGTSIIKLIWMPVLLIFPLAFVVIGWLLGNEEKRYQGLQAITEAENLFRATLYSIGDAVITTDKKGKIRQMNIQAEKLTGWQEKEAKSLPLDEVFRIINEDSHRFIESPVKKVVETSEGSGLVKQALLISKNKKEIPISNNCAPILGADGKILGVVVVFRDQTEEREYKAKIEESENQFRNLFENHKAVHLLINPENGNIENANHAACEFYGYSLDDLKNMNMSQINTMSPSDLFQAMKNAQTEKQVQFEFIHRLANGTERNVMVYSSLIKSRNKDYLYSIIHDITDRKELFNQLIQAKEQAEENERKLRISEERLRFSLEGANDGIWDVNMETGEVYISPRGCQLLGYEPYEMPQVAKIWSDLVYAEDMPLTRQNLEAYLNGETNMFRVEQRLVTKGGKAAWFLTRGKVTETTAEGRPRRMTGTHTDIADQKMQELELLKTQMQLEQQNEEYLKLNEELQRINEQLFTAMKKAEESERLKSVFLQNMSHEIRTPLNGILGFTSLLTEKENISQSKRESYSAIINRSAESLMQIINDILDLSRLETDQFSLNIKNFVLNNTLNDLYTLFRKRLHDKNKEHIQLKVLNPSNQIILHTDETRLSQILINLLDNAIKFTKEGSITFGVKEITNEKIKLLVSDTGIGISREKHAVIFDRFAQADINTSINYGGTGLGLSIVKKLVSIMEGKIEIVSEIGIGSTFIVELPYGTHHLTKKDSEDMEDTLPTNTNDVLLVEDDESSLVYYQEIMSAYKIKLRIAGTGKEALKIYYKYKPKIILIDIGLPDMNGLDVVKEIRKSDRKVKIIAQSAFAMPVNEIEAIEAGCNQYISKPVSTSVLLQILQ